MAAPAVPVNFYLQQGNAQVFLSWDLAAGATSYSVKRSTDGVSFSVLDTPVTNSYLDTAVTTGTRYFYQVAAVNTDGTSPYTAAQNIVPTKPGQMSLGELRLRSQQRADRVNSQFVTLPEWNYYINQSAFELYDLLITAYEDYFIAPRLLIPLTGVDTYDLPNGVNYDGAPALYKLYGVDLGINSNSDAFVSLRKFDFIQRNSYVYPQSPIAIGQFSLRYRMLGEKIQFIPTPSGTQNIGIWYYPRLSVLLQDTDVLDGISGWTEYVIVDAAIKALRKEESDVSELVQEKLMLKERIMESAANRDAGMPDKISDVRGNGMWGPYGYTDFGPSGGY